MLPGNVAVLDIGKTNAKLSLWNPAGDRIAHQNRLCRPVTVDGHPAIDTEELEAWVADVLKDFSALASIDVIVPVGHGATAAVVRDGRLACPVPDYESPIPAAIRGEYDRLRDGFATSGSPRLPNGLNLGAQLHHLESTRPQLLTSRAQIVTWPQYWAWRLSGVASTEITSLGCHTDLWCPAQCELSPLARRRNWDALLAPLQRAETVLGALTVEWRRRTGLGAAKILCGIHDSNASLLGARGFPEIADREATVVSTGTWFVALRSPAPGADVDLERLPETRDCLVNVDVNGKPVPSARFMGGREIAMLGSIAEGEDARPLLGALPDLVRRGLMVLPCWVAGVGPYPRGFRRWIGEAKTPEERKAAVSLYAALILDTSLELIGASERVLIEGRFAQAEVFVRALATLRPDLTVFTSQEYDGIACGALRLVDPRNKPPVTLKRAEPLPVNLADYRKLWRSEADKTGTAG